MKHLNLPAVNFPKNIQILFSIKINGLKMIFELKTMFAFGKLMPRCSQYDS